MRSITIGCMLAPAPGGSCFYCIVDLQQDLIVYGICARRQCFEIKCVDTAPFAGRCISGKDQVSVIVQITDACPECSTDQIDIQALTYNKLSPMDTGRISIMYRRVECVPPKPMDIYVDNNGGQGNWLRLFVEVRIAAPNCVQPETFSDTLAAGVAGKWKIMLSFSICCVPICQSHYQIIARNAWLLGHCQSLQAPVD